MPERVRTIPRLRTIDSSASFLLDGYTFGSRRFDRLGSDAFHTRLMFTPATFIRGEEASRLFYEGDRFTRTGALPASVLQLLQGEGSVQTLHGQEHHKRKHMFMQMMREEELARLRAIFDEEWANAVADWTFRPSVTLHIELLDVLTRTALRWAGVPIIGTEIEARAGELGDMIENAGKFGPANWLARLRRLRTNRWARGVIRQVRSGEIIVEPGMPLAAIVEHTDIDGERLDDKTAATELINVLRPIVAVGRFIVFAALALHVNPRWYAHFNSGSDEDLDNFVQEVRRFFPFFPAVAGRVRSPFEGMGHRFERHEWVLLDLYGTNHDNRLWRDPNAFRPERFRSWEGNPNTLIPQGAGQSPTGHRCPGEPITMDLMRQSVRLLSRGITYTVADQDLRVSLRRFPAIPEDGFVVRNVAAQA